MCHRSLASSGKSRAVIGLHQWLQLKLNLPAADVPEETLGRGELLTLEFLHAFQVTAVIFD